MTRYLRTTEHFVHGTEGPIVIVPARIAARLNDLAGLDRLRVNMRAAGDVELNDVLRALYLASVEWRSTATGTVHAPVAELAPRSVWLGTRQAADLLNITDRAVRKAAAEKRLPAERVGNGYRIRREDVEHYRAAREARAA